MFGVLVQKVKDISVVRRLTFASTFFSPHMPNYWQAVADFSVMHKPSRNEITPEQAKVLVENLEIMDAEVFSTEHDLVREIVTTPLLNKGIPLGVVLISKKENCDVCGSSLKVRADRPAIVTVYDDRFGTLPATHFTKYCRKTGCSFQQHYSFSTRGDPSEITYDSTWQSLSYFMSSRETAFNLDMLKRLDTEILIGQISYKQRADIYNSIHK